MQDLQPQPTRAGFLITAAAFVIVVAGMRAAEAILVPFLIAVFIAVLCMPTLFWLQKKGVPKSVAMLVVIAGISIIGMLITTLISTSLDNFLRDLPFYQSRLQEKAKGLMDWIRTKGANVPDNWLGDSFNPGAAMNLVAVLLKKLGNVFTNAFLILVTVVFILLEASSVSTKLRAISFSPGSSDTHFDKFIHDINRYMGIKTLTSFATGAAVAIWLTILGVDYPQLWGLLAFLLNFIPSVGSILAAIPAILLALIQLGTASALLVAGGYLTINISIGNFLEPRVMGRGLGLSPLVVFLSIVFWGWVLGPVGMLLSVPLTMTLKIGLDSKEDLRWIAVLLGSEASAENVLQEESTDTSEQDHSKPGEDW
ncbi:MAG: AI-2E family transporter [Nitrospiraceae bacterium]|nr:MAG: AI-2E family transporter [Nitrospiraceae bacterium]